MSEVILRIHVLLRLSNQQQRGKKIQYLQLDTLFWLVKEKHVSNVRRCWNPYHLVPNTIKGMVDLGKKIDLTYKTKTSGPRGTIPAQGGILPSNFFVMADSHYVK